jgi:hypothetical protein
MRLTDLPLRWRSARERDAVASIRFPKMFQDAENACWRVGAVALGGSAASSVVIRAGWFDSPLRPVLLGLGITVATFVMVRRESRRMVVRHLERQSRTFPARGL